MLHLGHAEPHTALSQPPPPPRPSGPRMGLQHPCVSAPLSLIEGVGRLASLILHDMCRLLGWRSEPYGASIPTGGGLGSAPCSRPAMGAPQAGLGPRVPALRLPTHTRVGRISTGLMVIYNGKPPLSPDIVLPDRGKKGGPKSPLIICNDEAAARPLPSALDREKVLYCHLLLFFSFFFQKNFSRAQGQRHILTGPSSLCAPREMGRGSLSDAPSVLFRSC